MSDVPEIPLRVTTNRKLADEWALVLVAQGLSPSVWEEMQGIVLGVPPEEVERATSALLAYESENPVALPKPVEWTGSARFSTFSLLPTSGIMKFVGSKSVPRMQH